VDYPLGNSTFHSFQEDECHRPNLAEGDNGDVGLAEANFIWTALLPQGAGDPPGAWVTHALQTSEGFRSTIPRSCSEGIAHRGLRPLNGSYNSVTVYGLIHIHILRSGVFMLWSLYPAQTDFAEAGAKVPVSSLPKKIKRICSSWRSLYVQLEKWKESTRLGRQYCFRCTCWIATKWFSNGLVPDAGNKIAQGKDPQIDHSYSGCMRVFLAFSPYFRRMYVRLTSTVLPLH
jgi:hypothetical protein